jgi:hypothetical protein
MGIKINEYTNEIFAINDLDYFDSDAWDGVGFKSSKLSGANLKTQVKGWAGKKFGSFYDSTTQTCASGTIKAMQTATSDSFNNGVLVGIDGLSNPTLFSVTESGVYNVQFSAQLNRTTGGSSQTISIWLRKNGTDVPNSATHVSLQANAGKLVAAWNYFIDIADTDKIQIMWSQNGAINLLAETPDLALPHPAIPSVIVTINQL